MVGRNNPKTKKKRRLGRKRGQSVLKEKVLQILSTAAQAVDSFGNFTYNPYPYLYASLGHVYNKDTINDAVDDLVKKGLVDKNEDAGLRLTLAGADLMGRLKTARQEEWDGKWRVVIFDIPEVQRDVRYGLRSELKKLCFGLWQRSVWVSPFDIAKELNSYLERGGLSDVVQLLVGERFGGPTDQEFAVGVWPLNDLNQEYAELLAEWGEELKRESGAKERLDVATDLHNRYLDILARDPKLPSELLPTYWVGDDAYELFKKLKSVMTTTKAF